MPNSKAGIKGRILLCSALLGSLLFWGEADPEKKYTHKNYQQAPTDFTFNIQVAMGTQ